MLLNTGENWKAEDGTNLGEYDGFHKSFTSGGNAYYVMRTDPWSGFDKPYYTIVDSSGKVIDYQKVYSVNSGDYENDPLAWARNKIGTHSALGAEAQERRTGEEQEVAPQINYSEFSQYIDETTGNITNKQGMVDYLKKHGMSGMSESEILDALPNMPGVNISAFDIAQARAQQQSDIYGLQRGMSEEREKGKAAAGAAGVYSPTSTGFGGRTDDTYAQLGATAQAEGGDVYGLAGSQEEELAQWIADLTTG